MTDRVQGLVQLGVDESELDLLICVTCGSQQPVTSSSATIPPEACKICIDPRQYVNPAGQTWTTLRRILGDGEEDARGAVLKKDDVLEDVYYVQAQPAFAINQRVIVFVEKDGTYIWDCIAVLAPDVASAIKHLAKERGVPIRGIFLSHPHFQTTSLAWAEALGCKVHASASDREWYLRADDPRASRRFVFFSERYLHFPLRSPTYSQETPTWTVARLGGHFDGSAVGFSWRTGALATGDTIGVTPRLTCSFMRSYPNQVPLSVSTIASMLAAVSELPFKTLLNGWSSVYKGKPVRDGTGTPHDADEVVWMSARLHASNIGGNLGEIGGLH